MLPTYGAPNIPLTLSGCVCTYNPSIYGQTYMYYAYIAGYANIHVAIKPTIKLSWFCQLTVSMVKHILCNIKDGR